METDKPKVMLPKLQNEELQTKFNTYAMTMGSIIANVVGKFMETTRALPEDQRPDAPTLGAACYVAAHMVADVFISKGDERGQQILEGLAATAMLNTPELFLNYEYEQDDPLPPSKMN
jgi:hypothetical protein